VSSAPLLHVITDEALGGNRSHLELARAALRGGADVVQYREKRELDSRDQSSLLAAIVVAAKPFGSTIVVNDQLPLALSHGTGLHVGRQDVSPETARRELGASAMIGATANNLEQARQLAGSPVDYLGVGPVFGTRSKARPAPILGLDGLAEIVAAVDLPVIAIGGIGVEHVDAIVDTGARGIAVLSAVCHSLNPQAATRHFRQALDRSAKRISV